MAVTLELKVVPSSGKQQVTRDKSGGIKCFLKSPPEGGKANAELIRLLSNLTKIPQNDIVLISGQTARKKIIKITTDRTMISILAACGIETQTCLS